VDQPAGTGYSSVTNYDSTELEVSRDFYNFFLEFLKVHPEYIERPFYVTGESFAGHYIPVIASYFFAQKNPEINVRGIAIGNGWVDPLNQYPAYPKYAYQNNLIDEETYKDLSAQTEDCTRAILEEDAISTIVYCSPVSQTPMGNPRQFNIYDIRLPCIGRLCYDLSFVDKFLAKPEVQEALGVVGRSWSECNSQVHKYFNIDHESGYAEYVSYLLAHDIPVLVYSGVLDYTCNYLGGEAWTNALEYAGHEEFNAANYTSFGDHGLYKGANGLTFFKVLDAGHLVPMDQPETAISMLYAFIDGKFDN